MDLFFLQNNVSTSAVCFIWAGWTKQIFFFFFERGWTKHIHSGLLPQGPGPRNPFSVLPFSFLTAWRLPFLLPFTLSAASAAALRRQCPCPSLASSVPSFRPCLRRLLHWRPTPPGMRTLLFSLAAIEIEHVLEPNKFMFIYLRTCIVVGSDLVSTKLVYVLLYA